MIVLSLLIGCAGVAYGYVFQQEAIFAIGAGLTLASYVIGVAEFSIREDPR